MRRRLAGLASALLLLLAIPATSHGEDASPASVVLQGQVEHPRTLALPDLLSLPHVSVTVAHAAGHEQGTASYTGALLWTLLSAAAPVDQPGGRTHLQHTILARGRDGYAVALAIGELDPSFEGKQVLIAYQQGGDKLATLRLVVPGDARAGRSVKDLVAVEVR